MLNYNTHTTIPVFGSKSGTTRTSVELESTYQTDEAVEAVKTLPCGGYSKMNLDILYTMGSAETSNSIEVRIEGSPDGTNFYRIANESVTGGTSTLTQREFTFVGTNGTTATISIGLDIFYKYIKIAAKETGVASNKGSIYGEVTLSGK